VRYQSWWRIIHYFADWDNGAHRWHARRVDEKTSWAILGLLSSLEPGANVNPSRIRFHTDFASLRQAGCRPARGCRIGASSLTSHEPGAVYVRLVHLSTRDIAGLA